MPILLNNRGRIFVYRIILGLLVCAFGIFLRHPVTQAQEATTTEADKPDNMDTHIEIIIDEQKLYLKNGQNVVSEYLISSSKYGVGSKAGSNQTPLGNHRVVQKFGKKAPINTIFKSRANTGKIATINNTKEVLNEDIITSRILWLEGLDEGINRGRGVDSYKRYIYIHGTADEGLIGTPASHGCIRMRNADVVELFDKVPVGTKVVINETRQTQ